MKKIALVLLILITTQSCQGNTGKNKLANSTQTENISTATDDVMEDLEGILELVKNNDFKTLKAKYLTTENDIQDFTITYGQNSGYWRSRYGLHLTRSKLQFFKEIKGKLVGTNLNSEDIEPLYFIADKHTTLKGLKRRKVTLIFGNKSNCYQMELYLIEHNGKRLYTFKKELDPMSKDYDDFKDELKKDVKRLKENNPDDYKNMEFEEY